MKPFQFTFLALGFFLFSFIYSKEHIPKSEPAEVSRHIASSTPILFLGDIMLGRHVETLAKKQGESFMFASTSDFLKSHISIANLEGPIPKIHKQTPVNGFSFSFSSTTPKVLKENGITAVSLANNHMYDKGRSGFEDTRAALRAGGVHYLGGYAPTQGDYFQTKLGEKEVVVYGITMIATGWNKQQALNITEALRLEHPDAHLVAFLHWGDEYVPQNEHQRAFAYSLIDKGVNAVIGTHPHVVQGIEIYKNVPIFYSLGNFIFDQYWRDDLEDGYMLRVTDNDVSISYEIIPIRSKRSVPSIAEGEKRQGILTAISKNSGADIKESVLQGVIKIPK